MKNSVPKKKRDTSKINYHIPCIECGEIMEVNRSTKKTCEKCKQKAKKAKSSKKKQVDDSRPKPLENKFNDAVPDLKGSNPHKLALDKIYATRTEKALFDWSPSYNALHLANHFDYDGPLPKKMRL